MWSCTVTWRWNIQNQTSILAGLFLLDHRCPVQIKKRTRAATAKIDPQISIPASLEIQSLATLPESALAVRVMAGALLWAPSPSVLRLRWDPPPSAAGHPKWLELLGLGHTDMGPCCTWLRLLLTAGVLHWRRLSSSRHMRAMAELIQRSSLRVQARVSQSVNLQNRTEWYRQYYLHSG